MIVLVIGGSGSGKSDYAEQRSLLLGEPRYYLATMQVYGTEGQQKVLRHQRMREGRGFFTIEQPLLQPDHIPENGVVLLECLANLTANVMFGQMPPLSADNVGCELFLALQRLFEKCSHLVVVSNTVFEDGIQYDSMTQAYLEALGQLNRQIAQLADEVVEVVAGIPVFLKKMNGEKVI